LDTGDGQFATSLFASPILWGSLFSAVFYGLIHFGVINNSYIRDYFAGHPVEYVTTIMFFMGMIMVPIGIYALLLPIVFPMLVKLGYDPIWFGVICLKLTEIGAITPPVGLNVYAMKGVIPKSMDISLEDIFRGIWPFCLCDIVVLVVLIMFPKISTWLPEVLLG